MGDALGACGLVDWTSMAMTTDIAFAVIGVISICVGLLALLGGKD